MVDQSAYLFGLNYFTLKPFTFIIYFINKYELFRNKHIKP